MAEATRTIEITDPRSKAFYAGTGVGMEVRRQLDQLEQEEHPLPFEQRVALFWLYAGTGATEKGVTTETMPEFIHGLSTQAPQRRNQFVLQFSTEGLYDPDKEPDPNEPDPLGVEIAHVLRNTRDAVLDMSVGDTEGGVYSGNKEIGKWEVHL